jgi:2-dehydropantoate 2-reductase
VEQTRPVQYVLIIGAGAMGCLFAARLAEAGATVTLVDVDEDRIARIAQEGLTLHRNGAESHIRPKAVLADQATGPVDVVMLFTKSMHSAAGARSVAHIAREQPVAITLQNGLGNADALADLFGQDRVLVGTAHVPAEFAPPNRVTSDGFSHVELGGLTAAAHRHAAPVAALLEKAGFSPYVTEHAVAATWTKLAFNAALNPLALVAGATNGEMDNPPARRIAHAVARETVAVAAAAGIVLDAEEIVRTIDQALVEHAGHKASMLQDFEGARPTEIEFINGAIVREGARLGVPVPVTETLADLVRLSEHNVQVRGPRVV